MCVPRQGDALKESTVAMSAYFTTMGIRFVTKYEAKSVAILRISEFIKRGGSIVDAFYGRNIHRFDVVNGGEREGVLLPMLHGSK